ncbi:MAG: response regulator [candidate division KSB1 bacterium]|nr:response regulator [candidate division KSB1 bacterium]
MENILIVDDEVDVLNIIADMIRKWGYHPVTAQSGQEALEKFKTMAIDVVLTDLIMPQMNGLSLLKEIMTINDRAMVIMLTGYPSLDSAIQTIKEGAYDYLVKPIDGDELRIKLERCLERKNLLRSRAILRGLNWALIISIPFWLILGIILARVLK